MSDTAAPSAEHGFAPDDAALVRAAQADPQRFDAIYNRYVELVYCFCRRRLLTVEAAEDATSLVFIKAMTALPRFDLRQSSFRSWLFTIAFNVVMDQKRSRLRRPEEPLDIPERLPRGDPSPEDEFMAGEERRSVSAAIARLTEDQRRVVELRLAGLSGYEISVVTRRSHGAVRTLQHRALLRLRELLGAEIGADEHRTPASPKGK